MKLVEGTKERWSGAARKKLAIDIVKNASEHAVWRYTCLRDPQLYFRCMYSMRSKEQAILSRPWGHQNDFECAVTCRRRVSQHAM